MIPLNTFLLVYLSLYVIISLLDLIIEQINAAHVKRQGLRVPGVFKGMIEPKELEKILHYTLDKCRFSTIQSVTEKALFLVIILSGVLPWLVFQISELPFVLAGLVFFACPGIASFLIGLPFDYFHSFMIEERYGFNTRTRKTWLSDQAKSIVLMAVLGSALLAVLFFMVQQTAQTWWLWVWLVFTGFQLLMTVLYPTLIAPLFNKFTPIEDPALVTGIERLAEGEGLGIRGIFQMDASRRSRHTNAYFSGLGKTKRIVLFDSLIASHDREEILAVLAHEIGHFKKNHIRKQITILSAVSLGLFYLASLLLGWEALYQAFGFSVMPAYVGLFLLGILWEPIGFFLGPLGMAISRKFEREADDYGVRVIGSADALIRALKNMAKDNLSNLYPHPLYVTLHYSHPPLLERVMSLMNHDKNRSEPPLIEA